MKREVFWQTTATVIPVLALAIIVEARAIIQRWNDDNHTPWPIRTLQGVGWLIPLVGFAIVEPLSFRAISGRHISNLWIGWTISFVYASMGVLFWAPALELLTRSNARAIAWTIWNVGYSKSRWKFIKIYWRVWRLRRSFAKLKGILESRLRRLQAVETRISSSGHPECDSCVAGMAEIQSIRKGVQIDLNIVKQSQDSLDEYSCDLRETTSRIRRISRAVIPQLEKQLSLMSFDIDAQIRLDADLARWLGERKDSSGSGSDKEP